MKVRKQEQVDALREQILTSAQIIIKEEGLEHLSMRKIANKMGYTQGSLYHYFKNKDEILYAITKAGYGSILTIIQANAQEVDVKKRLVCTLESYMNAMLERSDIFMTLMSSNDEAITSQVDLLQKDIRKERASIAALCANIEEGIQKGIFACEHVELRAQSIWCATFGMMLRILKENIMGEQRNALLEEHLLMVVQSLEVRR